jgi:hypothetical protein
MSSTNAPSVNQDLPLGLAQIEELQNALLDLKISKQSSLGAGKFRTVAFTETFRSQGEYTMASGFDEASHFFFFFFLICSATVDLIASFHFIRFTASQPAKYLLLESTVPLHSIQSYSIG